MIHIRARQLSLLIAMALASAAPFDRAWAACDLSINTSDISINWTLNFSYVAISVQVDKSTADACVYSLGITAGGAASYDTRRVETGGKILRYQLYKDSALTKVLKDGADILSLDEVVEGGFQAGATPASQTVVFYLEIPYTLATTPALVSSGTFTDSFIINAYESDTPPFTIPDASKVVNVTVSVPQMIALSLIDPGAGFQLGQVSRNVNFPTLSEGSASSMDLRVRTNAGFTVTFSSTNDGRLRHTDPLRPSYVPYALHVNGAVLNLASSSTVPVTGLSGSGSTGLSGLAYPIKLVIGSVTSASVLAGPHADDITITATTTE